MIGWGPVNWLVNSYGGRADDIDPVPSYISGLFFLFIALLAVSIDTVWAHTGSADPGFYTFTVSLGTFIVGWVFFLSTCVMEASDTGRTYPWLVDMFTITGICFWVGAELSSNYNFISTTTTSYFSAAQAWVSFLTLALIMCAVILWLNLYSGCQQAGPVTVRSTPLRGGSVLWSIPRHLVNGGLWVVSLGTWKSG